MSDVTFGVKVSPEVKEKVSAMIEASGMKSKEFFESLLSVYEMQRLKEGTVDFAKDLGELEIHTNRIVQLVGNMVTRATHEKEAVLQQVESVKASRDEIIAGYQTELSEIKKQIQEYKDQAEQADKDREESDKHVAQLEEATENHRDLIAQYKEKIDTLSGLVAQYKAASEENQVLKGELSSLQQKSIEQAAQIAKMDKDIAATEEIYAVKFAQQEERHKEELKRQEERLEFVKDRELLRLKNEYQDRIAKMNDEHTSGLKDLYLEINELRKARAESQEKIARMNEEHTARIQSLQSEINNLRKGDKKS